MRLVEAASTEHQAETLMVSGLRLVPVGKLPPLLPPDELGLDDCYGCKSATVAVDHIDTAWRL